MQIKEYVNNLVFKQLPQLDFERDSQKCSDIIFNSLQEDAPCMIARLGETELNVIVNAKGIRTKDTEWIKRLAINYLKGMVDERLWYANILQRMRTNAGIFPSTSEVAFKFADLMISDSKYVDILASWQKKEYYLKDELHNAKKIRFAYLEPYWSKDPWSRALEGKKVLVIHPFEETIIQQYGKRELLFHDHRVLPQFELKTLKAVQSINGASDFETWFDALEYMKNEMDKIDYDICLIGCGAYGFPLAAHAKRNGKKAVHMGGSLQLLFGIKGKRWERQSYSKDFNYSTLFNEYWVYPDKSETPATAKNVEGGCYWG